MTTTCSFDSFSSNTLEEIHMIAGDEQMFVYDIFDSTGNAVNLSGATCSVTIFRYGDPISGSVVLISGSVLLSPANRFTAILTSASSIGMQGIYQQQPKIVDSLGVVHIPAQGKIVVFPTTP